MKIILLIEDNTNILENLTEYLELSSYKVYGANNGKKGLALANKFSPDLIICDILMSEMDGYAVLHALMANEKTNAIPFIFSTSMSEKVDKAESLLLGADDYIVKPFEMKELLKLVKRHIKSGSKRHPLLSFPIL